MDVPRRIELMPVAPVQKKEKKKKTPVTLRFELTLAESNEKTCPEYSYAELVKDRLVSW